jgi:hypothetical protein
LVITAGRGLLATETFVTVDDLRFFASIPIDLRERRYREPLQRDAEHLAAQLSRDTEVILLGSIATARYREVLIEALVERLRFPKEFIGRGDMSRGGLMLRCVEDSRELEYISIIGANYRGPRPIKLLPRTMNKTIN